MAHLHAIAPWHYELLIGATSLTDCKYPTTQQMHIYICLQLCENVGNIAKTLVGKRTNLPDFIVYVDQASRTWQKMERRKIGMEWMQLHLYSTKRNSGKVTHWTCTDKLTPSMMVGFIPMGMTASTTANSTLTYFEKLWKSLPAQKMQ